MRFVLAAAMAAFLACPVAAQTLVERGKYLVESIAACGNCHTPQGPNGPVMSRALSGGPPMVEGQPVHRPCRTPIGPDGRFRFDTMLGAGGFKFEGPWGVSVSGNITSDPETGLGRWNDAEVERAIRKGVDRHGRQLMPPMGYAYYAKVSAEDMTALIAFLRTLPPKKMP